LLFDWVSCYRTWFEENNYFRHLPGCEKLQNWSYVANFNFFFLNKTRKFFPKAFYWCSGRSSIHPSIHPSIHGVYADDTNMTFTACSVEGLRHEMNADIEKLKQWLCANKLTLNILKTEYMLIGSRQRIATVTESLDLSINGTSLKKVNCSKCLGVELDEFLSWDSHITSVCKKVSSGIGVIKKINFHLLYCLYIWTIYSLSLQRWLIYH